MIPHEPTENGKVQKCFQERSMTQKVEKDPPVCILPISWEEEWKSRLSLGTLAKSCLAYHLAVTDMFTFGPGQNPNEHLSLCRRYRNKSVLLFNRRGPSTRNWGWTGHFCSKWLIDIRINAFPLSLLKKDKTCGAHCAAPYNHALPMRWLIIKSTLAAWILKAWSLQVSRMKIQ